MIRFLILVSIFVPTATGLLAFVNAPDMFGHGEIEPSVDWAVALLGSLGILLGVFVKPLYDALSSKETPTPRTTTLFKETLAPSKILRALIVTPVILAMVFGEISELPSFLVFLVSFQNGFFFQTITQPQ